MHISPQFGFLNIGYLSESSYRISKIFNFLIAAAGQRQPVGYT